MTSNKSNKKKVCKIGTKRRLANKKEEWKKKTCFCVLGESKGSLEQEIRNGPTVFSKIKQNVDIVVALLKLCNSAEAR